MCISASGASAASSGASVAPGALCIRCIKGISDVPLHMCVLYPTYDRQMSYFTSACNCERGLLTSKGQKYSPIDISADQGLISYSPNTVGNNIKRSICCTVYGCLITCYVDMFQIILAHCLCMPYIYHSILDYLMTETPTSKHKHVCIILASEFCM